MAQHPFTRLPTDGNDTIIGRFVFGYLGNDEVYGDMFADSYFLEGLYVWEYESAGIFVQGQAYEFGAGNDNYYGNDGFDVLDMSRVAENVTLTWTAPVIWATHTIRHGLETDSIAEIESVILGTGNDRIVSHAPGAYVDGGEGRDLINLRSGITGPMVVDLPNNVVRVSGDVVYHILNIEDAMGAAASQTTFHGDDSANAFFGGRARDTFFGGSGDSLEGGAGDDRFDVTAADVEVYGGTGDDTLMLSYDDVPTLVGTIEKGELVGRIDSVESVSLSSAGNDTVVGNSDLAHAVLGGGDDLLSIVAVGTFFAGDGNDLLDLSRVTGKATVTVDNADLVVAGQGSGAANHFEHVTGSAGFANHLTGGVGSNRLTGGAVGDSIFGGDGSDTLIGLAGNDSLNGGIGHDRIEAGDGSDLVVALVGVEVVLGGAGTDTIRAGFGAIYGGDDRDVIVQSGIALPSDLMLVRGDGGNDRIIAQSGDCGVGDDYVRQVLGYGSASGDEGRDTLSGSWIGGGADDDRLFLNSSATSETAIADGGDGNDFVDMSGVTTGRFEVYGGSGNDTVRAIASDAKWSNGGLSGDLGRDVLIFAGDLMDRLLLIETFETIQGSDGVDQIIVSDESVVRLLGGNDMARFHEGRLYGGLGDDRVDVHGGRVFGEAGEDALTFVHEGTIFGGDDADTITLQHSTAIGRPERSSYGGDGADTFRILSPLGQHFGDAGADRFVELPGHEVSVGLASYFGGADDDVMILISSFEKVDLGDGRDWLGFVAAGDPSADVVAFGQVWGGEGQDIYDLRDEEALVDIRIVDFDPAVDRIRSWAGGDMADFAITQVGRSTEIFVPRPDPVPDGGDPALGQRIFLVGIGIDELTDRVFL